MGQVQMQPNLMQGQMMISPLQQPQLMVGGPTQMILIQPQIPVMPVAGFGIYTFPNGDRYEGEWLNSLRHGSGKCTFISGMYYEGQWQNDMFHGQGKLVYSNTTYVGQFMNGKKNGQGVMSWNGTLQKYEGPWVDNNQHGEGVWTFANGQTKRAEFSRGQRVRWLDEQIFGLQGGNLISQGQILPSPNGMFALTLCYNGVIQVIHTQTKQVLFQQAQFARQIMGPFYLKLDPNGTLLALDATG